MNESYTIPSDFTRQLTEALRCSFPIPDHRSTRSRPWGYKRSLGAVFNSNLTGCYRAVAGHAERSEVSISEENGEAIAVGGGDLKCVGDIFSAHCFSFLVTALVRERPVAAVSAPAAQL